MTGYIYLIRNKDLYKIGITKDLENRMKVLKPDEIVKVLRIDSYKEVEKKLTKERHYTSTNRWVPTKEIKNGYVIN